MIVKNEEDWIAQCLRSVQSVVCEMIVVDTGSTDQTKEIARELGATVYDVAWQDDFAVARNFSLSKATGDWILVLDADEMIAPSDCAAFDQLTADRKVCTEFLQRHYTDDHRINNFTPIAGEFPKLEVGQLGYFESNCCRLFPNHMGLEFRGKIHELVEHSIHEQKHHTILRTNVRIHHYGHTSKVKQKKQKTLLYSPLGEQKAEESPTDWKALYELGVEYNCAGRHEESAKAFVRSIELNPAYLDTWVNLGYVFCELAHYDQAQKALLHALKINPQSAEAACNLGVVSMRQKQFSQAEKVLRAAIAMNPLYINARINLAQSLAHMGRLSESAFHYQEILRQSPRCAPAYADLGALYLSVGFLEEAKGYLNQALEFEPSRDDAMKNLGILQAQVNSLGSTTEASHTKLP